MLRNQCRRDPFFHVKELLTVAKRSKAKGTSPSEDAASSNLPEVSKQTAGGVTGAVLGGVVAGPVGAIAGGVVGAMIGDASAAGKQPVKKAVAAVRAKVPAVKKALQTVGQRAKRLTTTKKAKKTAGGSPKKAKQQPSKSAGKSKKVVKKSAAKSKRAVKRTKKKS